MKKTFVLILVFLFTMGLFSGCSSGQPGQGGGSTRDYAELIRSLRSEEENQVYPIITSPEDSEYEITFATLGGTDENMERYAVSLGLMITQAYGVVIVLPKEGTRQEVVDQLNNYVELQKNAFENYLADQYQIAKAAIVKEMETGEVVLVMSRNAEAVMQGIEDGLAGGA